MRVRDDIKQFAERMETRMREAAQQVAAGEIPHHKLMTLDDLVCNAVLNVGQLNGQSSEVRVAPEDRLNAAADCANYALFAAMKQPLEVE